MKPTLNIDEAAELMQIHTKTVLDLIANGTLPAGKIGRAYVLLSKDVMQHIEAVIVQQTAQRMGGQPRRRGGYRSLSASFEPRNQPAPRG